MDYRFCCFGSYQNIFKCLIKCPDKKQCEIETEKIKQLKQIEKEVKANEKDNKG